MPVQTLSTYNIFCKLVDLQNKIKVQKQKRWDIEYKLKQATSAKKWDRKRIENWQKKLEDLNDNEINPLIQERFALERELPPIDKFEDVIFHYKENDNYYIVNTIDGYCSFTETRLIGE